MKFIKPNFYDAFHCTAAACSDTCCAGWEIDVDPDTVEYYENLEGELGDRLREELCDLPDGTVCFRLGENERCPFLDDDNLCELILKLGDDALCEICREHPRFYEELGGRVEMGVGLCCEEAARLILTKKEKTALVVTGEGTLDEEETALLMLREKLFDAAQDRGEPLKRRMERILSLCGAHMPDISFVQWADCYLSLERMDESWTELLASLRAHADALPLGEFAAHMKTRETEYEQLLVYFLYRHVPEALDDGDVSSKAAFAVASVRLLFALGALHFLLHGDFTVEDQIALCRLYSAEVEYSDDNMEALFDALM